MSLSASMVNSVTRGPGRGDCLSATSCFEPRVRLCARLVIVSVCGAIGLSVSTGHATAKPPARVSASYDVQFSGVSIGRFRITTEVKGRRYTTRARAKVKLLLGALTWNGDIRGSGILSDGKVRPARFSEDLLSKRNLIVRKKRKRKTADLTFEGNRVVKSDLVPPRKTGNRAPLKPSHMIDVLDPAAAVLAMTQDRGDGRPCDRRLKVFNGRMRFDLKLRFLRKERLPGAKGPANEGFVCAVTYRPIGGHKLKDRENAKIMKSGSIEIVLRPVPGVDVFVPHQVRVKTRRGTAKLIARKVDILTAERRSIALVN